MTFLDRENSKKFKYAIRNYFRLLDMVKLTYLVVLMITSVSLMISLNISLTLLEISQTCAPVQRYNYRLLVSLVQRVVSPSSQFEFNFPVVM